MSGAGSRPIVLAAGGTGGHVFPAEALAGELVRRGFRPVFVTDRRGDALASVAGVETYRIQAAGVAGKPLAARLLSAPTLALGTLQARRILRRLHPAAVVGFGGYASVPTMLAASFGGQRTAIHEQNAVLGRANRLLAGRVDRIAASFPLTEDLPEAIARRVVETGMPVRPAILAALGRPYASLAGGGPIRLLVLGGSRGARVFSEVVPAALARLGDAWRARLEVAQHCRLEDLDEARQRYAAGGVRAELAPFFTDVADRLAAASLIIARAGASTVAEVLAVGRPAILVPYPFAIDDHQTANAAALADTGAGWIMPQAAFDAPSLADRLESLFGRPTTLEKAAACARAAGRPDAAARLAEVVSALVPNGEQHERRNAA